jgi:hypothetical protein
VRVQRLVAHSSEQPVPDSGRLGCNLLLVPGFAPAVRSWLLLALVAERMPEL